MILEQQGKSSTHHIEDPELRATVCRLDGLALGWLTWRQLLLALIVRRRTNPFLAARPVIKN